MKSCANFSIGSMSEAASTSAATSPPRSCGVCAAGIHPPPRPTLTTHAPLLEPDPEEYARLVNSLLIKVTEFFRDPKLFDYLREDVLPELIAEARRVRRELRIWSAGCSTG